MIRKFLIALSSLIAAGLMVSSAALAQNGPTYTFTVPVNISEVHPDVPGVRVYCFLRHSAGHSLAMGFQDITLDANRAYAGTVTVEIEISNVAILEQLGDWFCNVEHLYAPANAWMSSHQDPNAQVEYFHVNGDTSYEYVGEF